MQHQRTAQIKDGVAKKSGVFHSRERAGEQVREQASEREREGGSEGGRGLREEGTEGRNERSNDFKQCLFDTNLTVRRRGSVNVTQPVRGRLC